MGDIFVLVRTCRHDAEPNGGVGRFYLIEYFLETRVVDGEALFVVVAGDELIAFVSVCVRTSNANACVSGVCGKIAVRRVHNTAWMVLKAGVHENRFTMIWFASAPK